MHNAQLRSLAIPDALRMQLVAAQRRMMRKRDRAAKRHAIHAYFAVVGLNGPRAVERRARQIAAGSLTVANGLVEGVPL